jgi:hypothetical protein
MRKLLALSAVVLPVAVLGLAACGDDDDDDGGSDTTEVEEITADVTVESVVTEESEVVVATAVESVVESVVAEESVVVATEAGAGTTGG